MVKEWSNMFNPFNSMKVLRHANQLEGLVVGKFLPPVVANIDPTNSCNFNCSWCMAKKHRDDNPATMSMADIDIIDGLLRRWGVQSACIAGGGDPTLNPNLSYLITKLWGSGLKIGVVTNGYIMGDDLMQVLSRCEFVGFSVDAGTDESYQKLKGVPSGYLDVVMDNMRYLRTIIDDSQSKTRIGYKMLVHPDNYKFVYEAIQLAKKSGAHDFQLRPMLGDRDFFKESIVYESEMIRLISNQLEQARDEFEDNNFKVYGIVHKFNNDYTKKHTFKKCLASALAITLCAEGDAYICVDRRGEKGMKLGSWKNPHGLVHLWGSEVHKKLLDGIKLSECPRCTYAPYQEIIENIFIDDNMMSTLI